MGTRAASRRTSSTWAAWSPVVPTTAPAPRAAARREVLEGRLGRGELDEDAPRGEERSGIRADRHAQVARAGDLPGVVPESGVTGPLEGACHPEVGRVPGQGDDPPAHPPGRAGDDQLDHGPVDSSQAFRTPAWTSAWRSFSRFAGVMGHIGSRHSARIIPSMAMASFTGIGFVSMNIALQTG